MQLGSFVIEVLSEGRFEMFSDGHINRSSQQTDVPEPQSDSDQTGFPVTVGINPILIKTGPYNILLDTGLGWGLDAGSSYQNVSNVCTNLEIFELKPEDITHVILSHLHYDHAAGASRTTSDVTTKPTFPNATYYIHEKEWNYAISQIEDESKTAGPEYLPDDLYRLVANDRITFTSGQSTEILPGITTIWTGGHTPGHQVVLIKSGDHAAYYLGDLLPASSHLNSYEMEQIDTDPVQAKKRKLQLLRSAFKHDAYLLFYHDQHYQIGSLEQDKEKRYVLREIKERR
jgi:glyoxylase-like metal-dependent hydrolase (beta-lactamase superfamily II)